jgi:hypothetical protein
MKKSTNNEMLKEAILRGKSSPGENGTETEEDGWGISPLKVPWRELIPNAEYACFRL